MKLAKTYASHWCVAVLLVFTVGSGIPIVAHDDREKEFEVWLVDQSNTNGLTYGGTIYIYDGDGLISRRSKAAPTDLINLGGDTSALCLASTGANPVRPHM